ncbi:TetR/AcrR family transcriptional regulator [Streptomyces sp. CC208A]|uniref:TetR/AcrR family transcriptional regulator n=1 Tax=Streptomyces sp. CC208A TaxID=3044573 RepID=UPI0024A94DE2|nr:TetR/AcrR family transcriptional regulator [Streptomyces sp. CC208A]
MARPALSREEVLDTAAALVREHGPAGLTMRGLAAALGTAVTSIYWHVGNRESLLDALAERTVADLGAIRPHGKDPAERIGSVAHALRRALRERPDLVAMVHERGLTERMFLPAQRALVREAHAAGLRGARAAELVRAVTFQAVGHVLVERNRERAPVRSPAEEELRDARAADADPPPARALAAPVDTERLFAASVRALVEGLLAGPRPSAATDPPSPTTDIVDIRETGGGAVGRGPYPQ